MKQRGEKQRRQTVELSNEIVTQEIKQVLNDPNKLGRIIAEQIYERAKKD